LDRDGSSDAASEGELLDAGDGDGDTGGARDGAAAQSFEERLLGRYAMRLITYAVDGPIRPATKVLSLVDIRRNGSKLEMVQQPCRFNGEWHGFGGGVAQSVFDYSELPPLTFQLIINGEHFSTNTPTVYVGYDREAPNCTDGASVLADPVRQPWLKGKYCKCPNAADVDALPTPGVEDDCRLNDDDGDGFPGVTVGVQADSFPPTNSVFRVFQRSRDAYRNGGFTSDGILVAYLDSNTETSIIRCEPVTPCGLGAPLPCAPQYNEAEFYRLDTELDCPGLLEQEEQHRLFVRPKVDSCEYGIANP
jgi:hypothetical protein